MDRSKMMRQPAHPGELLNNGYMAPLHLSVKFLAEKLCISEIELRDFIEGRASVTVDLAMRLARAFATTPEFWMNAQRNLDVWMAYQGAQSWREVEQIYFPEKALEDV